MVCLYCGSETSVINSRPQRRTNHIWRRRQCRSCSAIFTTSEMADLFKSLSVKNDKHIQSFSRDKLFMSIHDSLKHRKTAQSDATGLTETVINQLYPHAASGQLTTDDITDCTMKVLKRFDKSAATHYRAFHPLI